MASAIETVLPPRYTSVEALARGGMGEIYEAPRRVARPRRRGQGARGALRARRALRARFTREALAAARLSSEPHTVTIYDVGEWNGRPYIVMELATGGTVADRLDDGGADAGESLRWLEQAARGARRGPPPRRHPPRRQAGQPAAHARRRGPRRRLRDRERGRAGLGHRDRQRARHARLPRAGAGARRARRAGGRQLRVRGRRVRAARRRRPFERATGAGEAVAAAREPVPPISSPRPGCRATLDPVFERALAADPRAALRLLRRIRRATYGARSRTTPSRPGGADRRARRPVRRSPPGPVAAAVIVLVLARRRRRARGRAADPRRRRAAAGREAARGQDRHRAGRHRRP